MPKPTRQELLAEIESLRDIVEELEIASDKKAKLEAMLDASKENA
jgi:hypothetical protein